MSFGIDTFEATLFPTFRNRNYRLSTNWVLVTIGCWEWLLRVCSVSKAVTYQLLKPQLDVVLFEIIFPLMCFNNADDQLWREDPHEYVRKGYGKCHHLILSCIIILNAVMSNSMGSCVTSVLLWPGLENFDRVYIPVSGHRQLRELERQNGFLALFGGCQCVLYVCFYVICVPIHVNWFLF